MQIDFHEAALKFVRDHKFCMTVQDAEEAMKIGAAEGVKLATERIKRLTKELEKAKT